MTLKRVTVKTSASYTKRLKITHYQTFKHNKLTQKHVPQDRRKNYFLHSKRFSEEHKTFAREHKKH